MAGVTIFLGRGGAKQRARGKEEGLSEMVMEVAPKGACRFSPAAGHSYESRPKACVLVGAAGRL
eukprot:SAG25_NODE_1093_length_4032_cov_2.343504_4_plen_64_part_00